VLALGLDTATAATATAVVEVTADRLVVRAERSAVDPRAHGELLAPQIVAVLADAGARPADLAAVVAGTGPGPFTGLRVGLVTAAVLGQALGIPTYAGCSLDALAAAAEPAGGRLLVATDARRREVYWAVYAGGGAGARLAGPAVERPAALAGRLADLGVRVAVGEGAHRCPDELAAAGVKVRDQPRYPPAAALVELAADRIRRAAPSEPLTPRYLRRPDAAQPRPPKPVLPR
jgi:tRNA threonylcarbamoyl adenosine modification protein YeaZ